MKTAVKNYIRETLSIGGVVFGLLGLSYFFLDTPAFKALLLGYTISFIYVASNYIVIRKIDQEGQKDFFRRFWITLGVRFLLVLTAFSAVLVMIKIDQILFTVSFIISYILHSVIEVIFINKILENENNQ